MSDYSILNNLHASGIRYAFYYKIPDQQPLLQFNCRRFSSASIIKVPLLLAWLYLEKIGQVDRAEICNLDDEPQVRGAGLAYLLRTRRLPYQDVLLMMLSVSDNLCTNLVIRRMGMERIAAIFADPLKLPGTLLQRKLMDFDARAQGLDNWITVDDCIQLYDRINELSIEDRNWVNSMLRTCQDDLLLLRSIPRDSVTFMHKTGSIPGLLHDWGYTRDKQIFLLTQGVQDEQAVFQVFGELGQNLLIDSSGN